MTQKTTDGGSAERKKLNKTAIRNRIIIALSACLILAVVLYVLITFVLFKVNKINVISATGNAAVSSYYTDDEIIEASDVDLGVGLFQLSLSKISEKITTELPYIGKAEVKRKLMSTLEITVTDTSAAYGIESNGKFIVLDEKFKVLGVESFLPQGASKLVGVEFNTLENGKIAEFSDSTDSIRLLTLVNACKEGGLTNITKYDIENVANVKIVINSRITVTFGTLTDIDEKVFITDVTLDRELKENANAHLIIDATSTDRSYVRNDTSPIEEDTIDYEEYSIQQELLENKDSLVTVG